MEGQSFYQIRVFGLAGYVDVEVSSAATIANVKEEVAKKLPQVAKTAPSSWCIYKDQEPLLDGAPVAEVFLVEAKRKGAMVLKMLPISHNPAAVGASKVAPTANNNNVNNNNNNNNDLAASVAKNIVKKLAGLAEDQRTQILSTLQASSLRDLSQLKIPEKEKKTKNGTGGASTLDAQAMEFMSWYAKIKEDAKRQVETFAAANGDSIDVLMEVDRKLDFRTFESTYHSMGTPRLEILYEFVRNANEALKTTQRLSMRNLITLGLRLQEAKKLWDELKGSPEVQDIHTLEGFYVSIGLNYTADYIRKLIRVGELGLLYPNLGLVSCTGIGELTKFAPNFMKFMASNPEDAEFWRCDRDGNFGWAHKTVLSAYDGPRKRTRVLDVTDEAPEEKYEEWDARRQEQMTNMLAESAAASKAQKTQQPAVKKKKDRMEEGD